MVLSSATNPAPIECAAARVLWRTRHQPALARPRSMLRNGHDQRPYRTNSCASRGTLWRFGLMLAWSPCSMRSGWRGSSAGMLPGYLLVRLGEVASGRPRFGLPGKADPTPQNVAQQQPLRRAPGELALVFGAGGLDGTRGHLHAQVAGARHGGRPGPSGPARRRWTGPTASDRDGRRRFRRRPGQGGGGGTSTAHRAGSRMSASAASQAVAAHPHPIAAVALAAPRRPSAHIAMGLAAVAVEDREGAEALAGEVDQGGHRRCFSGVTP